jgi:predicted transcriptional regulator
LEDRSYFSNKSRIAHEILAYLFAHPDAKDTLEGVMEWWLLEQKIKDGITLVKEALEELVEKGLVIEQKAEDTSMTRYQIDRSKREEIKRMLQN